MRWCLLLGCLLLGACAPTKPSPPPAGGQTPAPGTNQSDIIVTPSAARVGRVLLVNSVARHAILSFPLGQMPPLQTRLNVYRRGLKVGELRLSGPQRDQNIAADILAGDCAVGDLVREQ